MRLFCKTTKLELTRATNRLPEDAYRLLTQQRQLRLTYNDQRFGNGFIMLNILEPANQPPVATTALLHGWYSRSEQMLAFAPELLKAGHRVVAVDLPGHGQSSGSQFHIPLGVAALQTAIQRTGPWTNIIAHSLGGAVSTALVAGSVDAIDPVPLSSLVLLSSPSSVEDLFDQFARMLGLSAGSLTQLKTMVPRLSGNPISEFEGKRQLARAGTSTLVLHDMQDPVIEFTNALALSELSNVKLKFLDGVGHFRILYDPTTVAEATRFVTRSQPEVQPLQSEAR